MARQPVNRPEAGGVAGAVGGAARPAHGARAAAGTSLGKPGYCRGGFCAAGYWSEVMATQPEQGRLTRLGCWVSAHVAHIAGEPYAQIGLILFCILWFAIGWGQNALTTVLSILAITLTQMVLNQQAARELDAHRRDVALHVKLDELILASHEARDEVAGIEELEVEEIAALRNGTNVTPLPKTPTANRQATGA